MNAANEMSQFVEEQAIDRVHRLNQTRDVTVYRLTIADSVEERILRLQDAKRALANAALEGGKAVAKLSMKDILALFRHDAEAEWGPDLRAISGKTRLLKD
jgi:SNF2 family DNA or RNA helicase